MRFDAAEFMGFKWRNELSGISECCDLIVVVWWKKKAAICWQMLDVLQQTEVQRESLANSRPPTVGHQQSASETVSLTNSRPHLMHRALTSNRKVNPLLGCSSKILGISW